MIDFKKKPNNVVTDICDMMMETYSEFSDDAIIDAIEQLEHSKFALI